MQLIPRQYRWGVSSQQEISFGFFRAPWGLRRELLQCFSVISLEATPRMDRLGPLPELQRGDARVADAGAIPEFSQSPSGFNVTVLVAAACETPRITTASKSARAGRAGPSAGRVALRQIEASNVCPLRIEAGSLTRHTFAASVSPPRSSPSRADVVNSAARADLVPHREIGCASAPKLRTSS
jgi:hypothetical protein